MAKMFVPENDKWGVKISMDKRRVTRPTSTQRRIVIHNTRSSNSNNRTEKWREDLKKFIADSKKEIDFQARSLIESAKRWQQSANDQFDMIQQHISRSHNLQIASTAANDEERPTERRVQRPVKTSTEHAPKRPAGRPKKVCFPSMPVLIMDTVDAVDDLKSFLTEPSSPAPPVLSKKIIKRRSTVCVSSPESEHAPDEVIDSAPDPSPDPDPAPAKISRTENSSALVKPVNTPKSSKKSQEPEPTVIDVSRMASNTSDNVNPIREEQPLTSAQRKDEIFQKFLETRRIVLAREKQREEAARAAAQSKKD